LKRYICIHGHFYQPPRENPWLETIESQGSAYPFHDWNERITSECYGPNATARILDNAGYIEQIVATYERISFNFGPTLLAWMERARPAVYEAILAADRASCSRFGGHGSALAQAYNHSILPLCNPRDRQTQVRWGLRDFERRFQRTAEGIWLPETAADTETLEVLADEGVKFTILAPHQAARVRSIGETAWRDVGGARIDPRRAYRTTLPSGKSIDLFFYDGPVSQAVAFERLLNSGDRFADRLMGAFDPQLSGPQLVHIATDGETYGHHHRHGEMALAYALRRIDRDTQVSLTNYGLHLERHPPEHEVEIAERTSWSCAHGIERWRKDCGCSSGMNPSWHQAWRQPLRQALDWLAENLANLYETQAAGVLRDPWAARDAYIDVILDRSDGNLEAFLRVHGKKATDGARRTKALKLLEMQRHAMLMYTSCGWFFDELSGIETTQIIRYAARAIQLAQEISDVAVETPFLERLSAAPSNLAEYGNGREIYEKFARPQRVDLPRLVAHFAVSSLFTEYQERSSVFCYSVHRLDHHATTLGRSRLAVGKLRATSDITRESATLSYGFIHLGDHNMSGGVRAFQGEHDYEAMRDAVSNSFDRADVPEALRLLDKHFGELTYSMRSLFRDEQARVLDVVVGSALRDAEALSSQLYDRNSPLLRYLATLDLPLPRPVRGLADFVLNTMIRGELRRPELDNRRIEGLLREADELDIDLDRRGLSFALQQLIERNTEQWVLAPDRLGRVRRLRQAVELANELPFDLDLVKTQNQFWALMLSALPHFVQQSHHGDAVATEWVDHFKALGKELRVRVQLPAPEKAAE
jgi:alpha-amylase/alpha-mannosidase (GH57 family)